MGKRKNRSKHRGGKGSSGSVATWNAGELRTYRVGALPIINHVLKRTKMLTLLQEHLLTEDGRTKLPTARGIMLLVRNVLIAREPLYGIAEWACQYAPDLLDLTANQVAVVNDDRAGRWLTKFFASDPPSISLRVTSHCTVKFSVRLDELHNDSTTVTFHGAYDSASTPTRRYGRTTSAITHGHNKDHRPDLKQLLFVLTLSHDGGIPLYFQSRSGNVADDQTHRDTWDILHELVGRPDFLYVADCKLASNANLVYIDSQHGRFATIMPRTRKEDRDFRAQLVEGRVTWRHLWDKRNEYGKVVDEFSVAENPTLSAEGFRLIWYHSAQKAKLDAAARATRIRRCLQELGQLQEKLRGTRTRFRDPLKVHDAVAEILKKYDTSELIHVTVTETPEETFRQNHRGRPGPNTQYIKHIKRRFDLTWEIDQQQLNTAARADGVFPLITNDRTLSELELLHAYKRQPVIKKRFEQLKTDYAIAPVWLKDGARVEAILGVYFLALLAESLLERELRQAMKREGLESLPIYPEGRECRCPTARRLIDLFDSIQRHEIHQPGQEPTITVTQLTPLQRQLLQLLGISDKDYGMPQTIHD